MLALCDDGTLWTWGNNRYEQLGIGGADRTASPTEVTLGIVRANFGDELLNVPWDDKYLYADCSTYNDNLAQSGIILCKATYPNEDGETAPTGAAVAKQFGFSVIRSGINNDSIDAPGFFVAYRATWDFDNPHVEILMAIRGSNKPWDYITDLKAVTDGFEGATKYCYTQLKEAKNSIITKLTENGVDLSKRNTKYFITGHSLGGACAGKLSLWMANDGYANVDNMYVYTFAAPKYTADHFGSNIDTNVIPSGLFNIINNNHDMVPEIPSVMFYYLIPLYLYHPGTQVIYSPTLSTSFLNAAEQAYGSPQTGLIFVFPFSHKTETYLACLWGAKYSVRKTYDLYTHVISVFCPVDVTVYDADGELCGYTEDGTAYNVSESAVVIITEGDSKYVELPSDGEYTIKLLGTGSDSMRITEQIYSEETRSIISEREYENVKLEPGKMFETTIDTSSSELDADIFVMNEDNYKIGLLNEDGTETRIVHDKQESLERFSIPQSLITASTGTYTAIVGYYSSNGQMVTARITELTIDATTEQYEVEVPEPPKDYNICYLFLTDGNYRPVSDKTLLWENE